MIKGIAFYALLIPVLISGAVLHWTMWLTDLFTGLGGEKW